MKLKRQIGAKLNLSLDIVGEKNGYHLLNSLVVELSLCDTITIKGRKDDKITLKVKGAKLPTDESNSAYKAAKLFIERFEVPGVDIIINKKIPIGGGLGGSSADAAGVLLLMKEYYSIDGDLSSISSLIGSDVYYMTKGKTALMQGKGEAITKIDGGKKLYFLLAPEKKSSLSKDCYKEFDKQNKTYLPCTAKAIEYYKANDFKGLISVMKNDLLSPAISLVPEIGDNLKTLSTTGNSFMTGSGSTTFSVFESESERDICYNKLKKSLKLIKAESII